MEISRNTYIIIGIVSLVVSLAVGFIIGHFTVTPISNTEKDIIKYYRTITEDYNPNGLDELIKNINPENIRKNLKYTKHLKYNCINIY